MRFSRPLVLASGSPRRRQLLMEAGLAFRVVEAPEEVENEAGEGFSPAESAEHRALVKAAWVAERHPGAVVLGADTIVVLDGEILGKPTDEEDACRMLRRLSGRAHEVVTGFAALGEDARRIGSVATKVSFRPLDGETIARYAASGEPMGKAGAYAIQGMGGALVDRVEGSYTNVVGLPVREVLSALAECGAIEAPRAEAEGQKTTLGRGTK